MYQLVRQVKKNAEITQNATEMHFWKLDCPISLNEMAQNSISKNFHKV